MPSLEGTPIECKSGCMIWTGDGLLGMSLFINWTLFGKLMELIDINNKGALAVSFLIEFIFCWFWSLRMGKIPWFRLWLGWKKLGAVLIIDWFTWSKLLSGTWLKVLFMKLLFNTLAWLVSCSLLAINNLRCMISFAEPKCWIFPGLSKFCGWLDSTELTLILIVGALLPGFEYLL